MKAIVHIGTEKTGTTSIQNYLHLNQMDLKNSGFHFIQCAGATNNRAIPSYCMSEDRFDDYFRDRGIKTPEQKREFKKKFLEEFENEIRSAPSTVHTFIMSSEHFHSRLRSAEEVENVHKLLSAYFDEFKIICYLREQVDTCTSYYSTHLKSGGTSSFAGFLKRCEPENYYFNYYEMLSNWERCFGGSLDVSLFAKDQFLNGDLLDDFTAKMDPEIVGTLNKAVQDENESLKPVGQALARAANHIFPVRMERADFNELRAKCKQVVIQGLTGKGQRPDLESRQAIFASFIESNEKVRQKYFPQLKTLFQPSIDSGETDNTIGEKEFEVITDFLNVIKTQAETEIFSGDYGPVLATIFSYLGDVADMTRKSGNNRGIKMIFTQEDVALLLSVAGSIKGRKPISAFKLLALANRAFPHSPGIKEKMEEYRKRSEQPRKPQFLVTYQPGAIPLDSDEAKEQIVEFQQWLASLDVPEGSPLVSMMASNTVYPDGTVSNASQLPCVGFTLFQADSMDEALSQTKSCPLLALGATLEVSEINRPMPTEVG